MLAAFLRPISGLEQMSALDLQKARDDHLYALRRDVLPAKRQFLAQLQSYVSTAGQVAGELVCERIFHNNYYEVKPRDFHGWNRVNKQAYETQRRNYTQRTRTVIPYSTYAELHADEQAAVQQMMRNLGVYAAYLEDQSRDAEVAFGRPHPPQPCDPATNHPFPAPIAPPLLSRFDAELSRRAEGARLANAHVTSAQQRFDTESAAMRRVGLGREVLPFCPACETSEHVSDTIENAAVCSGCGMVLGGGNGRIDETMEGVPFGTMYTLDSKGAYERTANFMKNFDLLEASPNNKVRVVRAPRRAISPTPPTARCLRRSTTMSRPTCVTASPL